MEHFPRIADPVDPIKVPYKGGTYRGGNFATYPEDQDPAYDLTRLQQGDFGGHDQEAVAQMLQAWLYFGLLKEALQLEIVEADFITKVPDAEGRKYITTERLREYLHRWRTAHENAKNDPEVLDRRRSQTIAALRSSRTAWSSLTNFSAIVGPEVELSIQLLAYAIEHAVLSVTATKASQTFDQWILNHEVPWRLVQSPFIENRMKKLGWCPSVIAQLGRPTKLALQTFVSLLKPSFKCHENTHLGCNFSMVGCQGSNVDKATYETKHLEDCECLEKGSTAFLKVDAAELRQILKEGGIPLVYLDESTDAAAPKLKLIRHRHELQYTAISHVWADGLGNPTANALPICQIRKILYYLGKAHWTIVSKTPPTIYEDSIWKDDATATAPTFTTEELHAQPYYFWMDTLCVPVDPQDIDLRRAAIRNMRAVYNRSNRVLVLENSLLNTPGTLDTLSAQEILARIYASSWVRRYWTLQEGLLARRLLFQFKEQAFDIIDPPDQTELLPVHYFDDAVGLYADNGADFGLRRRAIDTYAMRVLVVWSALGGRSTSYKADESLCVATLLDMDLKPLLELEAEERYNLLWRMYKEIPLGVLCRPAEKLDDPRQPWAFRHMQDCTQIVSPTTVRAEQLNGVLHFMHHGLIISEPLRQTLEGLIAVRIDSEIYFIRQNEKNGNRSWKGIAFTDVGSRMAVVLGQDKKGAISGCLGALVSLQAPNDSALGKDRVLKGQYLRAVSVMKKGSVHEQMANPAWSEVEEREKKQIHLGVWVEPGQNWQITGPTNGS